MVYKFQRLQLALGLVLEQPIKRGMLLSKWATISHLWICVDMCGVVDIFLDSPPPPAKKFSVILVPTPPKKKNLLFWSPSIGGEPQ